METLIATVSLDIAATPDRVFRVLTEPAFTRRYMFGCEPVTDWQVGSPLLWRGEVEGKPTVFVKGTVLGIAPPRYLRYSTFGEGMGLADVPANYPTVTCRLEALAGGGTRLHVEQGDFAGMERGRERYEETAAGWGQVAASIKALAEEEGAAASP